MANSKKNPAPAPMISENHPVDWLFIFKFNAASFPECTGRKGTEGIFGGTFRDYGDRYSQQYVYASSENPKLQKGKGCIGTTLSDPLGATFAQIYNENVNYVLWNDQFYNAPIKNGESPWGHSKGALAWNDDGEGMVLQVSTPSWPGSGSKAHPRTLDGNTLGTIKDDDIEVSQHFFALKLSKADVQIVLQGLQNASVVTNISKPQIVSNGGPTDIQALVKKLGRKSKGHTCTIDKLSSGVQFISKPSKLAVPPWQLVSAKLGSIPLRVASWWARPEIYSTDGSSHISCWATGLGEPGDIEIATTGSWDGVELGMTGGEGLNYNHAKLGISKDPKQPLSIFGDMNQQGAISPGSAYPRQRCTSSQNGRGGTFYVLNNKELFASMTSLLKGNSAPIGYPKK